MTEANDCIFCAILAGDLPASFVYREEVCSALMDVRPVNPGHVLVVPNRHAAYLEDLREEEGARVFEVGRRVTGALRKSGVRCEGVNLWLADGEAAGQEVFHAHLHVVPRYEGDGFGLKLPDGYGETADRTDLDAVARGIEDAL